MKRIKLITQIGGKALLRLGGDGKVPGGIPHLRHHRDDGLNPDGMGSGNWWIRSNFVDSDRMPTRRQPDFKKALSTLYRLKKAEDKKHNENWSQSSSSWWQWHTTWWDPDYENLPQRWSEH